MINYETLMLVCTEITGDEISALESQIDKIVTGKKGQMTLFDKWGKYKLAYPVKKSMYGVYILARYELPEDQLSSFFSDIDTLFRIKYNELVMRHVTLKLADDVSSVYKYPEPIGSHGTSNLDSFIKENKMKGLIDTPVKKEKEQGKEEAEISIPVEEPVDETDETEPATEEVTSEEEN